MKPRSNEKQAQKGPSDLDHWSDFVKTFFSPLGVLRHCVKVDDTSKQYDITFPALPRYFNTHFQSGMTSMQMLVQSGEESRLPNGASCIQSKNTSFVYWFGEPGSGQEAQVRPCL